jgi:hypothetical protein
VKEKKSRFPAGGGFFFVRKFPTGKSEFSGLILQDMPGILFKQLLTG